MALTYSQLHFIIPYVFIFPQQVSLIRIYPYYLFLLFFE